MTLGSLSLSISKSTISLGSLSAGVVSSDSSLIKVTTDSLTGYTLSINSVSGTSLTPVSGGSVDGSVEAYGLNVSGNDSQVSGDVAIQDGLLLASTSTPITNDESTLTFKAVSVSNSTAGTYSQIVNLVAYANF